MTPSQSMPMTAAKTMVLVGVGGVRKKNVSTTERDRYKIPRRMYFGKRPPNQPASQEPKMLTPPMVARAVALSIGSRPQIAR